MGGREGGVGGKSEVVADSSCWSVAVSSHTKKKKMVPFAFLMSNLVTCFTPVCCLFPRFLIFASNFSSFFSLGGGRQEGFLYENVNSCVFLVFGVRKVWGRGN